MSILSIKGISIPKKGINPSITVNVLLAAIFEPVASEIGAILIVLGAWSINSKSVKSLCVKSIWIWIS